MLGFKHMKKKKVICAISGGIDSSVAAALLKKQGYDVIGVFMRFWYPEAPQINADRNADLRRNENRCCSAEAQADARKVAAQLKIPFYTLNLEKEFKKRVVDYFIEEYKKGRTPNPCVECNRWIKFKFLMEKALALKADYIATGHYARIKFVNSKQVRYSLMTAKDKTKDQSYFLWTLTQNQLKRILFPIGDYKKKEVRAMAKKWGLPVYEKRESQEICFLDTDLRGFLKSRIHAEKGPIVTTKGEKVGEHEGLAFYTIGQRKGIKIGGIGPFYVVGKDFKKNTLIVAKSEQAPELYKKEMIVEKVNWISGKEPNFPLRCRVKIRYLHPASLATITKIQDTKNKKQKYLVVFDKKQRAITPGQSAVFYRRNEVLGGGIIEE